MATKEQLERALRKAHAAGDTAAARRLAQAIRGGEFTEQQSTQSEAVTPPPEQAVTQPEQAPQTEQQPLPSTGGFGTFANRFQAMPADTIREQMAAHAANREAKDAKFEELKRTNPDLAALIENPEVPVAPFGIDTGLKFPDAVGRYLVGAGKGLTDYGRAVGLAESSPEQRERDDMFIDQSGVSGFLGEMTGQTAPLAVGGLGGAAATAGRGLALRAGTQAAIEGFGGGLLASGQGGDAQDVMAGTLTGAAFGAGGEVALPALALGKRWGGKLLNPKQSRAMAKDIVSPTGDINEGLFQTMIKDLPTEDAARVRKSVETEALFKKYGLELTEPQRQREATGLWTAQADQMKTEGGDQVRRVVYGQDKQMADILADEIVKTGGNPAAATSSPRQVIVKKVERLDQEISDLYKMADEAAGGAARVRPTNTALVLRQLNHEDTATEGVIGALSGEMKRLGLIDGNLKPTGTRITPKDAETLRQYANKFYEKGGLARRAIREFKDGLDKDTLNVTGTDLYEQSRKAKENFERGLSRGKLDKYDKNKQSLVRDILDNKVSPKEIERGTLFSAGSKYQASDLAEYKAYLTSGDPDIVAEGHKAWSDLQAAAMEDLWQAATKGSATELGTATFKRGGFEAAINKMGRDKYRVLFDEKQRQVIDDMLEIAKRREPPPGRVTGSGPSGQAVKEAASFLENIPLAGAALKHMRNKATNREILKLKNDFEMIQKKQARQLAERLRKGFGDTIPTAAAAGTAATSEPRDQDE